MSATSKGLTAEQKGDELIEKFYNTGNYATRSLRRAAESTIIAVEEIISELPDTICGYMPEGGTAMEIDNYRKYYWNDVLKYLKSKL